MVALTSKLMDFLCEINRITNGKYYVVFDNDSDDIIFVTSATGYYSRYSYQLCARYFDKPMEFVSKVL